MEILSRVHSRNLVRWAKDKPRVVVFSADLTSSCEADAFREAYPDRFFSWGVAEQNMLSAAGGMAREGFFPLVHTFGVFIYRRAYDQVAMSIAYPNLPVRMFGFLPGITTPGGATHQAIDDIALMRTLPNMTVLECGDATEVESVLDAAQSVSGPVYVRMLRGEIPVLFPKSEPMKLDKVRVLSKSAFGPPAIVLFTSGICTEEAMRAVSALTKQGVPIQHLHVSTHKPFHDPLILESLNECRTGVITMENHLITGGLGSAVAEVMAANSCPARLVRMGLKDTFSHGAGRKYLMKECQIDAISLIQKVEDILEEHFGITEEQLADTGIGPEHAEAKAEEL